MVSQDNILYKLETNNFMKEQFGVFFCQFCARDNTNGDISAIGQLAFTTSRELCVREGRLVIQICQISR